MMFQPYSPNMYPQILFFFLPFCSSSVFFLLLFSSSSLYASLICSDLTLWLHSLCSLILPLLTLLHHFHLYPPNKKRSCISQFCFVFFKKPDRLWYSKAIPRSFQKHTSIQMASKTLSPQLGTGKLAGDNYIWQLSDDGCLAWWEGRWPSHVLEAHLICTHLCSCYFWRWRCGISPSTPNTSSVLPEGLGWIFIRYTVLFPSELLKAQSGGERIRGNVSRNLHNIPGVAHLFFDSFCPEHCW